MSKKIWLLFVVCCLALYFLYQSTLYNTSADGQNLSIKTVCTVKNLDPNGTCQVTAVTTVIAKKDTAYGWKCCQTPETAQNITGANNTSRWLGAGCNYGDGNSYPITIGESKEFVSSDDSLLSPTNRFTVVDVEVADGREVLTTHQKVNLAIAS